MQLLDDLHDRRMFIVYALVPRSAGNVDKIPYDPVAQRYCDAQDPTTWMLPLEALLLAQSLGEGYGVGIVIHKGCGIVAVDYDKCRDPSGAWMPHVPAFMALFPGAAEETSQSRSGKHQFFSYAGAPPRHTMKNATYRMECYTEARFFALTGYDEAGSVLVDHTAVLAQFLAQFFPPSVERAPAEWTDSPREGWRGPEDDAELVAIGRRIKTVKNHLGVTVPFAPLWDADVDALARFFPPKSPKNSYDQSSADQALCNQLAWLTGGNCERILRMMLASPLAAARVDPEKLSRADYLPGTIIGACAGLRDVYVGPPSAAAGSVPAPLAGDAPLIDRSDVGNANLLIAQSQGSLRYVPETRQWLHWTGRRWQLDEHEVFVTTRAIGVADYYLKVAKEPAVSAAAFEEAERAGKWAVKCRSKGALDNMTGVARKLDGVPLPVNQLDRDPWLFGVENGVIDLRTGILRESESREDYVTKRSPLLYASDALAPKWEQFILEITGAPIPVEYDEAGALILSSVGKFIPRPALARFLHKALGYSLTGVTREHKFFIACGEGSNGKSALFDTVTAIVGPQYMAKLSAGALIAPKFAPDAERATSGLAALAGARFAIASETRVGEELDVTQIKSHTGDSELTARRMRENHITFTITHKTWLLTNHMPAIAHMDAAIRDRIVKIPFDRRWNRPDIADPTLPEGVKDLKETMRETESQGILAWLVRGAMLYAVEGLSVPEEAKAATADYIAQNDGFGQWLAKYKKCHAHPGYGTMGAVLFSEFTAFCSNEGHALLSLTLFGRTLKSRGIESKQISAGVIYGIKRV